jgi:iron complex outermembrane recepter protein
LNRFSRSDRKCAAQWNRASLLLLLLVMPGVWASESVPGYFDISPQPMDTALIEFSEQANVQLMIATELVENLMSVGVRGRFRPEDALAALIAGSGLAFQVIGENAIAIVREDNPGQP